MFVSYVPHFPVMHQNCKTMKDLLELLAPEALTICMKNCVKNI